LDGIHFGCDLENFYLRVDFRPKTKLPPKTTFRANFILPQHRAIVIPHLKRGQPECQIWDTNPDAKTKTLGMVEAIQFDQIVELAVPLKQLGWSQNQDVAFFVQLLGGQVELERHPELGTLNFTVPDELFEVENWRV
jgi:hypothetical protein